MTLMLGIVHFLFPFFKVLVLVYILKRIQLYIIVRLIYFAVPMVELLENGVTQQPFRNAFRLILQHVQLEIIAASTAGLNLQNI
jgi:hypothetical protein